MLHVDSLTRLVVDAFVHVAAYSRAQKFAELETVAGLRQVVHVQLRVAEFRVVTVFHDVGRRFGGVAFGSAIAGSGARDGDSKPTGSSVRERDG